MMMNDRAMRNALAATVSLMIGSVACAQGQAAAESQPAAEKAPPAHGATKEAYDPADPCKLKGGDYAAPDEPVIMTIGPAPFLTVEGKGAPDSAAFQSKVGALYMVAFTLKMGGRGFQVCPLEGLWWGADPNSELFSEPKDALNWKLMIRMPDFVTNEQLADIAKKMASGNPAVAELKLETIEEGPCVQVLHVGPYDTEPKTIAKMKAFAVKQGVKFQGLHHEIYLNDPQSVAPEKLRTILRHPVK